MWLSGILNAETAFSSLIRRSDFDNMQRRGTAAFSDLVQRRALAFERGVNEQRMQTTGVAGKPYIDMAEGANLWFNAQRWRAWPFFFPHPSIIAMGAILVPLELDTAAAAFLWSGNIERLHQSYRRLEEGYVSRGGALLLASAGGGLPF